MQIISISLAAVRAKKYVSMSVGAMYLGMAMGTIEMGLYAAALPWALLLLRAVFDYRRWVRIEHTLFDEAES